MRLSVLRRNFATLFIVSALASSWVWFAERTKDLPLMGEASSAPLHSFVITSLVISALSTNAGISTSSESVGPILRTTLRGVSDVALRHGFWSVIAVISGNIIFISLATVTLKLRGAVGWPNLDELLLSGTCLLPISYLSFVIGYKFCRVLTIPIVIFIQFLVINFGDIYLRSDLFPTHWKTWDFGWHPQLQYLTISIWYLALTAIMYLIGSRGRAIYKIGALGLFIFTALLVQPLGAKGNEAVALRCSHAEVDVCVPATYVDALPYLSNGINQMLRKELLAHLAPRRILIDSKTENVEAKGVLHVTMARVDNQVMTPYNIFSSVYPTFWKETGSCFAGLPQERRDDWHSVLDLLYLWFSEDSESKYRMSSHSSVAEVSKQVSYLNGLSDVEVKSLLQSIWSSMPRCELSSDIVCSRA